MQPYGEMGTALLAMTCLVIILKETLSKMRVAF